MPLMYLKVTACTEKTLLRTPNFDLKIASSQKKIERKCFLDWTFQLSLIKKPVACGGVKFLKKLAGFQDFSFIKSSFPIAGLWAIFFFSFLAASS